MTELNYQKQEVDIYRLPAYYQKEGQHGKEK